MHSDWLPFDVAEIQQQPLARLRKRIVDFLVRGEASNAGKNNMCIYSPDQQLVNRVRI